MRGKANSQEHGQILQEFKKKKEKLMNKKTEREGIRRREENNTVVGGWNQELNRLVSSRLFSKRRAQLRCQDASSPGTMSQSAEPAWALFN